MPASSRRASSSCLRPRSRMTVALRIDQLRAEREDRIERRHRVLEDHGDARAAQMPLRSPAAAPADPRRRARCGRRRRRVCRQQAEQRQRERRLAAAALADQADDAPLADRQADVAQHMQRAVRTWRNRRTGSRSRPVACVAHGSRLSFGIDRVAQALAEQREAERRQRQHAARHQHRPDRLLEIGEAVEQHRAPARQRRADADAEEAQARLQRDDDGDVHARPARRSARRCWAARGRT